MAAHSRRARGGDRRARRESRIGRPPRPDHLHGPPAIAARGRRTKANLTAKEPQRQALWRDMDLDAKIREKRSASPRRRVPLAADPSRRDAGGHVWFLPVWIIAGLVAVFAALARFGVV